MNLRLSVSLIFAIAPIPLQVMAQPASGEVAFPSRPLRIVVPFFPGGTPDIQARILSEKLSQRLGQPVVIDNRGGANGVIGMELVARAPADGHTVACSTVGAWTVHPYLYKLPYDILKDFTPVIHVANTPGLLVVHPSVPAKTLQELIALAKARPGQLSYGSAGIGGWFQIATELLAHMAQLKLLHVPYKGASAALTEVMGGHVHLMINTTLAAAPHMQSGKLRALATTSARRLPTLPNLPTIDESGVRGYDGDTWTAIGAPARTPRPAIERVNRDINAVLQLPDIQQRYAEGGSIITGGTPEQFHEYLKSDLAKYGKLIRAIGLKEGG